MTEKTLQPLRHSARKAAKPQRRGIPLSTAAVFLGMDRRELRGLVVDGKQFTELPPEPSKAGERKYKKVYLDPEEVLVFKNSGPDGLAAYRRKQAKKAKR